jgi:porphobilinogen synthase
MSIFPTIRMRRLRDTSSLRAMLAETKLEVEDLIKPVFIVPGKGVKNPIITLPDQFQFSIDQALIDIERSYTLGIKSVILFGIPEYKDEKGSAAIKSEGIIQQAVKAIKEKIPQMIVIADLCFCEYTSHGHCGVIYDGKLENDQTLVLLAEQAVSLARSGVDMVAPSGMIDGAVQTLRPSLDNHGFQNVLIMGYSAKFASSFYGPFRDAAGSSPEFGDRKSYQMNYANKREAIREVLLDIEEGADIVMVKPALSYLDIITEIRQKTYLPIAAYNVSGEYAMIKAAASMGMIEEKNCMFEVLTSIKRAGADLIITYFADQVAEEIKKN